MPILGSPISVAPSGGRVVFNIPTVGISDGDTIMIAIFGTDSFNEPAEWDAAGFTEIDSQTSGGTVQSAHKTIVTAANEPAEWVIGADEFTPSNGFVAIAWIMPGPFVKSVAGVGSATGQVENREYPLENISNVAAGNSVFNISAIKGNKAANGVINNGDASVLTSGLAGLPDELAWALAAQPVLEAGASNLGSIVYPNTSAGLPNISMEFGGAIAAPQNVGWVSEAGFDSAGNSRANETGVRAVVRTEIGATEAPLIDSAFSYNASGILEIDSDALGDVGDSVDITLIHADGETITFESQALIDLDA